MIARSLLTILNHVINERNYIASNKRSQANVYIENGDFKYKCDLGYLINTNRKLPDI